jgi:hypothetical protein
MMIMFWAKNKKNYWRMRYCGISMKMILKMFNLSMLKNALCVAANMMSLMMNL